MATWRDGPFVKPEWEQYELSVPYEGAYCLPHDLVVDYLKRHTEVTFRGQGLTYYEVLRLAEEEMEPHWSTSPQLARILGFDLP